MGDMSQEPSPFDPMDQASAKSVSRILSSLDLEINKGLNRVAACASMAFLRANERPVSEVALSSAYWRVACDSHLQHVYHSSGDEARRGLENKRRRSNRSLKNLRKHRQQDSSRGDDGGKSRGHATSESSFASDDNPIKLKLKTKKEMEKRSRTVKAGKPVDDAARSKYIEDLESKTVKAFVQEEQEREVEIQSELLKRNIDEEIRLIREKARDGWLAEGKERGSAKLARSSGRGQKRPIGRATSSGRRKKGTKGSPETVDQKHLNKSMDGNPVNKVEQQSKAMFMCSKVDVSDVAEGLLQLGDLANSPKPHSTLVQRYVAPISTFASVQQYSSTSQARSYGVPLDHRDIDPAALSMLDLSNSTGLVAPVKVQHSPLPSAVAPVSSN